MANQKIIEQKQAVVNEITDKLKDSASYVLFEYRGLTVGETNELRRALRESNSEFKVYKNTLTKRALESINIDLNEHLNGPKAIAFGKDEISAVKTLSDFAKKHKALEIKAGVVNGDVVDSAKLAELASIPSREGLLTMLASGLMGTVRDLSICLDLYGEQLEK
ncbi:MAG: 50S ribosomal protein L10 [Bacilli bacterium]|nr:50S ribosomal protein L10 [Bacilli bacterium]